MSKTKKLLIQIAGCLVLGTVLGMAFWLFDGGRCRTASECPGGLPIDNDKAIKVYQGQWHKTYLEVIK